MHREHQRPSALASIGKASSIYSGPINRSSPLLLRPVYTYHHDPSSSFMPSRYRSSYSHSSKELSFYAIILSSSWSIAAWSLKSPSSARCSSSSPSPLPTRSSIASNLFSESACPSICWPIFRSSCPPSALSSLFGVSSVVGRMTCLPCASSVAGRVCSARYWGVLSMGMTINGDSDVVTMNCDELRTPLRMSQL